jgi:hypothetical protein
VLGPRPADDRLLGIPRNDAPQPLAVAVPQHVSADDPEQRSSHHLKHDGSTGQIEPHDGVRPLPDGAVDDHRSVVPVDHPAVAVRDREHASDELVGVDRVPPGLVVDRVELDVRDAEHLGHTACQPGLAGACVPHHRHPLHDAIIADDASAVHPA